MKSFHWKRTLVENSNEKIHQMSFGKENLDRLTIDHEVYTVQANGGKVYNAAESAKVGNYNWLLDSCPKDLYDNSKASFNRSFSRMLASVRCAFRIAAN